MASNVGLLSRVLIIATMMQFLAIMAVGAPQVPCYFIFGDSLDSNGNNNNLQTQAKANYMPYGIDFPQRIATGRFTNGLTSADFIGQLLGFADFIPPFATVTNDQLLLGVNYASGAAGIRDDTSYTLGQRISLNKQLLNHAAVVSRIQIMQHNITFTNNYLSKCIYTVNIGSNDYINNYFMPDSYVSGQIYTPDQYASVLITQYSQQLKTLYKLGARKVAVFGLGAIGCAPFEIQMFGANGQCVESINNKTQLFNDRLPPLIDDLNNQFTDARFTFINITSISARQNGGVALPNVPCCQVRADGQCIPNSIPCPDRSLFQWFDGLHPTSDYIRVLATRSYNAVSPSDAHPYDIKHLASLTIS